MTPFRRDPFEKARHAEAVRSRPLLLEPDDSLLYWQDLPLFID